MPRSKYRKSSRGLYETNVWDGTYTAVGKKRYKHLTDKTIAGLEKQIEVIAAAIKENNAVIHSDQFFQAYAYQWLETAKAAKEKNTQAMYRNVIKVHLAFLALTPITEIRHSHFQQAVNNQLDHPRTCQNIDITFKQVIKAAIRDRLLPKSAYEDICGDISLPRYQKSEKRPLTDTEKEAVKKVELDAKKNAFLKTLYYCGVRRGEALALSRFDFDFKENKLSITKCLIFVGGIPEIKPYPKSHNGIRKIPIPSEMVSSVREFVESSDGGCLFRTKDRSMMTESSFKAMWGSIITSLNVAVGYNPWAKNRGEPPIRDLTPHVFRHNYCTELCYRVPEISTKMIARLLGDNEKMVLNVYSHIVEEKENVMDVVADALAL